MRQVMLYVVHLRLRRRAECLLDGGASRRRFSYVADLLQDKARIGPMGDEELQTAQVVDARLAIDRDVLDIGHANAAGLETVLDGLGWQAGPVLDATEPLFLGGRDELAVLEQARRRVAVVGVKSQNDHCEFPIADCGLAARRAFTVRPLATKIASS
jgi:hypothetical protein